MSPSATSTWLLNPSRDGDPTTALGSLAQRLTTLSVTKFFLISNLNPPGATRGHFWGWPATSEVGGGWCKSLGSENLGVPGVKSVFLTLWHRAGCVPGSGCTGLAELPQGMAKPWHFCRERSKTSHPSPRTTGPDPGSGGLHSHPSLPETHRNPSAHRLRKGDWRCWVSNGNSGKL